MSFLIIALQITPSAPLFAHGSARPGPDVLRCQTLLLSAIEYLHSPSLRLDLRFYHGDALSAAWKGCTDFFRPRHHAAHGPGGAASPIAAANGVLYRCVLPLSKSSPYLLTPPPLP
ncbi:hypothetical protein PLICRDRAFT_42272 [Plicaturopsis crispa FD-325 SS-3]|nr:hypothetical protein PLICRDRAFT_42272 [Plicaturopsis crispa FD-325 SS-3]